MPIYRYQGKNKVGNFVEGERYGRTQEEVINALRKDQITILLIEKKKSGFRIPFLKGREGVSLRTLAVFNRQFSVMFNAGLSITQILTILAKGQTNKYFQQVLLDVRRDVEGGTNLSTALRKHPKVFNDLYCSMIQAGEASGNLDTILNRLSQYIETTTKLVGKVRSALAYPIAVLLIAIVLTAVIMIKVVPVFQDMFNQLGAELPVPTQIVISISDFLVANFWLILGAIIGLIFVYISYYKTYKGRRTIDRLKLKIPVIGTLLLKTAIARVTRTLSTLIVSGVEMLESISITAKTAGNAIVEDALMKSRYGIQEGKPIGESLEEQKIFPFMVTQMVSVGEQSGSLSTMLSKIADFYEEEVDNAVSALLSLMEPIMIVLLGGIVGGVIIAMYLPMFDLVGKVG